MVCSMESKLIEVKYKNKKERQQIIEDMEKICLRLKHDNKDTLIFTDEPDTVIATDKPDIIVRLEKLENDIENLKLQVTKLKE